MSDDVKRRWDAVVPLHKKTPDEVKRSALNTLQAAISLLQSEGCATVTDAELVALLRARGVAVVEETWELSVMLNHAQALIRPPWVAPWASMLSKAGGLLEQWAESEQGRTWEPMPDEPGGGES